MRLSLRIAISPNPLRQQLWRIISAALAVLSAWIFTSSIERLLHQYDSLVPPPTATNIRLIRSPKIIHTVRQLTGHAEVIPGLPQSPADLLIKTRRVLNIWVMDDGNMVIIFDTVIDEKTQEAWRNFGATVSQYRHFTILSNTSQPISIDQSFVQGIRRSLIFTGDGTLTQSNKTTTITFQDKSITANIPLLSPSHIAENPSSATLFSAHLDAVNLAALPPSTLNTPGITQVINLAKKTGLSALIEERDNTLFYHLALPKDPHNSPPISEDFLTALAQEIVEIPTAQGLTGFLTDGTKITTMRTREEATIVRRQESPYSFLTATTAHHTVYITQTPSVLTISNYTGVSPSSTDTPSCLGDAHAIVKPKKIHSLFFSSSSYQPSLLTSLLWQGDILASNHRVTRLCF